MSASSAVSAIIKRDGSSVDFQPAKITNALAKAGAGTGEFDLAEAGILTERTLKKIQEADSPELTVEQVQDLVEEVLLESRFKATAKAYILYREKHALQRKRDVFKRRLHLKPFEYPELAEYVDSVRHSYWIHSEFNYTSDIQDFKVHVTDAERSAIRKVMLAIAQIEVSVKTFWGDIFKRLPKPEIGSVGYTFAESEVRHHDAYSHLLEILGLNREFEGIRDIPCMIQRIRYLDKTNTLARGGRTGGVHPGDPALLPLYRARLAVFPVSDHYVLQQVPEPPEGHFQRDRGNIQRGTDPRALRD
jgi:ribonucleoside-diphosphate reductase beta chain